MNYLITVFTNQFFLMFLTIAFGLMIGKIKIGNFSLGVSGGIFSGIIIGYFVTRWAQGVQEGEAAYQTAAGILKNGVVANIFFIFFLLLFLLSIGLKVGGSIGTIFKKYGFKFVVIGVSIPLISMLMAVILQFVVLGNNDVTEHETAGMFAGAMTSTPGYGTALDASNAIDYKTMYTEGENKQKEEMLKIIDPSGELTVENTTELSAEQANTYKEAMASKVSLGYTVAFPMGVLVIVVLISLLPRIFHIDLEKEKAEYEKEIKQIENKKENEKIQPLNFMTMAVAAVIGILIGNINIPLGDLGTFSLGTAGGVLLAALILSYIGKIGPLNFRMDPKGLGYLYQMGLTFLLD